MVGDLVTGGSPEHVWAGDPRTRSAVAALLPGIDFAAQAERLSGGESRRVALAALLLGDHDLLLLDEPTNHLDVEAVDWLARFLTGLGKALVVVTHDRWFLDAVCERTWELADGQLHAYDGVTPPMCWPGRSGPGSPTRLSVVGGACCARNWPGFAAGRPPGPASRSSGSRRLTRSSPTSQHRATGSSWSGSPRPGWARPSWIRRT